MTVGTQAVRLEAMEWTQKRGRRGRSNDRQRREHIVKVRLSLDDIDRLGRGIGSAPLSSFIRDAGLKAADQRSIPTKTDKP